MKWTPVNEHYLKVGYFSDINLVIGDFFNFDQVIIAQWLACRLATGEVSGSNPSKGENLLISN